MIRLFKKEEELLDQCLFGLLKVNLKGEILYADKTSHTLLRQDDTDLRQKLVQSILPNSNVIRAIKNKKIEVSFLGTSDQLCLMEMPDQHEGIGSILIFKEKDYQSLVSFSATITDLKQELEAIMNLSGELVTITDGEGNLLRVNAACERLMGVKEHEFVGKSVFHLQDKGILSSSSTVQVIKNKRMVTVTQETKSGRRLFVRGYPIFNENGDLNKVINFSRDITEESKLKRNLEEAKELVSYYQVELNRSRKKDQKIIVKSKSMEKVYDLACRIADVETTVLILGESGVGKEVLARTIHQLSSRQDKPFIKINCGAIPENLIESELFGYSKGTFTGADREGKKGLIMAANKGTLFLDEIGELPYNLQVKLLQVLQEKQMTPLGQTTPLNIDVRFITATNRDLEFMVNEGSFRKDLYYRLNVVPITIPPLRERKEDIPFLIDHFLERFNRKYKQSKTIDKEVVQLFVKEMWDGNVRELQNTIERLVVTVQDNNIRIHHLPQKLRDHFEEPYLEGATLKQLVSSYEKKILIKTLESSRSMKQASEKLGVDISTISRKVRKHKINIAKMQYLLQENNE